MTLWLSRIRSLVILGRLGLGGRVVVATVVASRRRCCWTKTVEGVVFAIVVPPVFGCDLRVERF